ncbi:hypothetical protein ASPZODRAFT_28243 [Penicilliopsis zonata CBS 506.65]|uniref:ubiquitinyl hydrolase 1 n=1 Tax=Penicilliopsis zonata CBS 506.65 TaxID=1073090 RepID=A0A1L9S8U8_9EURO|nr:hypothetical protein ASPZODRAFT_28243 [Penicilliopsis zonata CBS 506.65]OJJ43588.1 hypothetical protein ASPZODRAFT_28243 [Penicilliopsis zonata CBS 506.65]
MKFYLDAALFLVNHVFLPPKVPGEDDTDDHHEQILVDLVLSSLRQFRRHLQPDQHGSIHTAISMLATFKKIHDSLGRETAVNNIALLDALAVLSKNDHILLHIRAQNAGVLISNTPVGEIHVEAFELSPTNEAAMSTAGRLQRTFPGPAVVIPAETACQASFHEALSHTLSRMSHQSVPGTLPSVRKARQKHAEDRDTVHPRAVTELLFSVLSAVGEPLDVSRVAKNCRDEVVWEDSRFPWRRSPLWMLLRVAVQLILSRSEHDLYKRFMMFFMAKVLEKSGPLVSSDLVYAMTAKLTRRWMKLRPPNTSDSQYVQAVMKKMNQALQDKWETVSLAPKYDLDALKDLDFGQDTYTRLPLLDDYLDRFSQRTRLVPTVDFEPTSALAQFYGLPVVGSWTDSRAQNLAAVEKWVASSLPGWIERYIRRNDTCGELSTLLSSYHKCALLEYTANPEGISIMVLTLLEIWIACDMSATAICPLLTEYDPDVPEVFLSSLVLPLHNHMVRLGRVEEYISSRRQNATLSSNALYHEIGTHTCFSVRYFRQSSSHQSLLGQIEERARRARQAKREELSRKKERYRDLMDKFNHGGCKYVWQTDSNGYEYEQHLSPCERCRYQQEAKNMDIGVHEWPVSASRMQAESTIFELRVPMVFAKWRDITVFIRLDVLGMDYTPSPRPRERYLLRKDHGLSSFYIPMNNRIVLLSQTKPHVVTHRRSIAVSIATEESVCVNNGLRYEYFDAAKDCLMNAPQPTEEVAQNCMFKLPACSAALQPFLFRPPSLPSGLPPNIVIAKQSDCPIHMSLSEYRALVIIPLGLRIQWQNVLLQLVQPGVDWKKEETAIFVRQVLYQAAEKGPDDLRIAHAIFRDDDFIEKLLEALNEAFSRIKENWESTFALSTFIAIATRALSLSDHCTEQILGYLQKVRAVAFQWVTLLKDKRDSALSDDERADYFGRAAEIALVCLDSFNVEGSYLSHILGSPEASIFLKCMIVVHEGSRSLSPSPGSIISILLYRWKRLTYRVYPILVNANDSLNEAIMWAWSSYTPGTWTCQNHWMAATTDGLSVHFDLLTGELLVNGLPLARLPAQYEQHRMYSTLFGRAALEVMPSSLQGMRFSATKMYAGYRLHLGIDWGNETNLLVRAVRETDAYELIPSSLFHGELPIHFEEDYVHWYNTVQDCVEFRPKNNPWASSAEWKLINGHGWQLVKGEKALISVHSKTAKQLSTIFNPLASPLRIHTFSTGSGVEIDLPTVKLGFTLSLGDSSIYSRQFRGMTISADQSIGTLIGLRNKLLLHQNGRKLLIIPEGDASWRGQDDHISVSINTDTTARTHVYRVCNHLGRLRDNGSLQSKLFLSYLHALTSFCLPDPLTGRTGTEEAISILKSAAVRSFDRLSQENIELLQKISLLTPDRKFYPANERVMQTVDWIYGLSFLSQHPDLYYSVKDIFGRVSRSRIFYPESDEMPVLDHVDPYLLDRDARRTSVLRVAGFGASYSIRGDGDSIYTGRDRQASRGKEAFTLARMVYDAQSYLPYSVGDKLDRHLWKALLGCEILPPSCALDLNIQYDAQLLEESSMRNLLPSWSVLHRTLSGSDLNKYHLMMFFATLAYAQDADMDIIQAIASFSIIPKLGDIFPPEVYIKPAHGAEFNKHKLINSLQSAVRPLSECPGGKVWPIGKKTRKRVERFQNQSLDQLANAFMTQWPSQTPYIPADSLEAFSEYISIEKALDIARQKFKVWFDNYHFCQYLRCVSDVLCAQAVEPPVPPVFSFDASRWPVNKHKGFIGVNDLFQATVPAISPCSDNLTGLVCRSETAQKELRLSHLLNQLDEQAASRYEKKYVRDLRVSLGALQRQQHQDILQCSGNVEEIIISYRITCQTRVSSIYDAILSALTTHPSYSFSSSHWPRISPIFLLEQLSQERWHQLSACWKEAIVSYGIALTDLQRAERLLSVLHSPFDLVRELRNSGHTNWSPIEHPDSLLLEVESGILIRDVQEQIASEMRDPGSGENTVMQLNMGEGKSSVIVPIVASFLANREKLVRVLVAKPQSAQMFQMLVSSVGGLVNRQVYKMPFSRSLRLNKGEVQRVYEICHECMCTGGILLVQPEHLLSWKLMGLERMIGGEESVAKKALDVQHFFDQKARNIVDESDENFSVKFELVYTMGTQGPVEFSPQRWLVIQHVLRLVRATAPEVRNSLPESIEIIDSPVGSFPRTRFLRLDGQQHVLERVARHICETGLPGVPIARQPQSLREKIFRYITVEQLTSEEISRVEDDPFWETTKLTLLLLRGLLAGGILGFAFGTKRWRVHYGLDEKRTPPTRLAVPYRAKDNPSPRSEFSHPDVVIMLTALSSYYGGLTDEELYTTFTHLLQSDQASANYQSWVDDAPDLPSSFHQVEGINLRDRAQCISVIFPKLRYSQAVIDYFLANLVYPREMRAFPSKLSASGWDIGKETTHPTTGFSGTNDARTTLPLSVNQIDLPEQRHTNALVLEYLLQEGNRVALMGRRGVGAQATAEATGANNNAVEPESTAQADAGAGTGAGPDTNAGRLLDMVVSMPEQVQVILDVGAQIIEMDNESVARSWLHRSGATVQAAVFVNSSDELCVVDRQNRIEPLQISPFATQMDVCLVFLDEAHTRGIDLRLPKNAKAAVTLGAGLTKDRLVQACMRMRGLGHGQTVVFCVPEEIQAKITPEPRSITVSDVLCWVISETATDMRRSIPLWAAQGRRFQRQEALWEADVDSVHAQLFLEDESQSLSERYQPKQQEVIDTAPADAITARCREFDNLDLAAHFHEEQERELSPEIEQERHVQRPPPVDPAKHAIHPDVHRFISTGMKATSSAFIPAFEALENTSIAGTFDLSQFPRNLWVTDDFARTVLARGASDLYQRGVQWIITSQFSMVIVSPYEADQLIDSIKKSTHVTLHIYGPRQNQRFRSLDSLDWYSVPSGRTVPRESIVQLNLFAGQLYLGTFEEYVEVCNFLNLAWESTRDDQRIAADGFILDQTQSRRFKTSPVQFLRGLLQSIRAHGGMDRTHLGRMLDGVLLSRGDFETVH